VGQWEHSKRVDAAILPAKGSDTMRKLILLLFICLIPLPALALDITVGDVTTCADWLHERDKLRSWVHSGGQMPTGTQLPGALLIGFLRGYDRGWLQDKSLTDGLDTGAVFERVDNICKSKPRPNETNLELAALELVKQLDPLHSEVCQSGLR
jgi:hypothetical protein